ncbi:MAG: hypothetical protein JXN10_01165 [Clostridia bacterium]|nr:hypothetical protein [Clostridia bacterium]MBN2882110.1 hypothetical protein [Clostridia bacterium]
MFKRELISQKKFHTDTGLSFMVEYYITMDEGKLNELTPGYGVLIEKNEQGIIETYDASCCFHEYAPAYAMAEKLSRFGVTPVAAEETIEAILEYINR